MFQGNVGIILSFNCIDQNQVPLEGIQSAYIYIQRGKTILKRVAIVDDIEKKINYKIQEGDLTESTNYIFQPEVETIDGAILTGSAIEVFVDKPLSAIYEEG